MLEALKKEVYLANLELPKQNLVKLTWGNASGIDRVAGLIVIKPSGVAYEDMRESDMVVVDLSGKVVEGDFRPSSDMPTHLYLYQHFPELGGIVHTHSAQATAFAQAEKPIPCFGTTHADYFYGTVPCTRQLTKDEIESDYEWNTGAVIAETMDDQEEEVLSMPGILVGKHGVFTWGKTVKAAVEFSIILEETAHMAAQTLLVNPQAAAVTQFLLDKHYFRKHGKNAYYGQKEIKQ